MKKYVSAITVALCVTACGKTDTGGEVTFPAPAPTPAVTVTALPQAVQNIACNVYDLSQDGLGNGTVPDTETLTPVAQIQLGTINAPAESVSDVFQLFSPALAAQLTGAYGLDCDSVLNAPTAGNYVMDLGSDDGSQLFIDGVKIIDNNYAHGMQFYTANVNLTAGAHKIRVLAAQNGQGQQGLELAWQVPGQTFQTIIPADSFSNQ